MLAKQTGLSRSEFDDLDWSIEWLEPLGLDFESNDNDDEDDSVFGSKYKCDTDEDCYKFFPNAIPGTLKCVESVCVSPIELKAFEIKWKGRERTR
ncbi:unnamed protein product [Trifolium pratense]|uniref:Uncharacterized protein n=1 Tax=Trifolium pratense TaxID=57577 RepID=A0ACB0LPM1_TRIPR|nr:unnamed protein product [Trifolium pratense]